MRYLLGIFFWMICGVLCAQNLKSPEEFLRTDYGEEFTPHHLLVDYIEYVAANSDRVQLISYGETNEDRPLLLATVSTPENLANIDSIRKQHLAKIGMEDFDGYRESDYAVVWLSYGVHGNEAGGSESSMNVLYNIANESNSQTGEWLKNTIVLIDPSLNPDGYNRYTHWVRGIGGKTPHPGHIDREHAEPWPGGRVNHYLFDLNRDWAWQTQVETQQRIKQYVQWMPHVHADVHEMGYDDGYYFAPAAEPYHKHITDFQRDMQVDIGRNHAKYFDRNGWLYFTREIFDLFYPSYGDTYPTFNGAVGMTYEQAGHGMAGRQIALSNGDTLKIQDRIDHHTQTSLSTIEEASKQAKRLNDNFKEYFSNAVQNPKGKYLSYVIKNSDKADHLAKLLENNNIKYHRSNSGGSMNGYSYLDNREGNFQMQEDDIIINANQPNGTLLQVLMEPEPILSDSVTYDITAWSLPHAYGVEAYALKKYTSVNGFRNAKKQSSSICFDDASEPLYAFSFPWQSVESAKILSKLYGKGINVRMAKKAIDFKEGRMPKGAIAILRGDNFHIKEFKKTVGSILSDVQGVMCLFSGFSSSGGDLGSSSFARLSQPKTLLLAGTGTESYSAGQVWHYFDEVIGYPLSIKNTDNFEHVDLSHFNTLILPDGYYNLSKRSMSNISSFVNGGGRVIAIGGALSNFTDKDGFALAKHATKEEKEAAKKEQEDNEMRARKDSYHDQERRGISSIVPGAIIKNELDTSHPLAFGLGDTYHSLKTSGQHFSLLKDAWNVVTVPKGYTHFGFIGSKLKPKFEESFTYAVEEKGGGKMIYMVDNPLYRGFWYNGLVLFSNAVFLVQ